jgi:hypothetical protein
LIGWGHGEVRNKSKEQRWQRWPHLLQINLPHNVYGSEIRLRQPRDVDDQLVSWAASAHHCAGREQRPGNRAVAALQGAEPKVRKGLRSVLVREHVAEDAVVHMFLQECRQTKRRLYVGSGGRGAVVGPDEGVDCDEPISICDLLHLMLAVGIVRDVMVLGAARPVVAAHAKCVPEIAVPNHGGPASKGGWKLDYQGSEHSYRFFCVLVGFEMASLLVKQQLVKLDPEVAFLNPQTFACSASQIIQHAGPSWTEDHQ